MKTPKELYDQLKHQARQLLLTGDLERYLRTLRMMHDLKLSTIGRA